MTGSGPALLQQPSSFIGQGRNWAVEEPVVLGDGAGPSLIRATVTRQWARRMWPTRSSLRSIMSRSHQQLHFLHP